ncbi:MAG: LLM class F420-dependent oxidoreductase [Dehalococcoidia bacterium]|nr:LLM class F420-dependent oxidoreductase [Dehalococcoidia bacterium]
MKFGLTYWPTHYNASVVTVAREAERLGFESLFIPEHSHIPVDTDFPLAPEVPMLYKSMFDPFVSLAAAAAVTENLRVGTAIALIPQRDPIHTAKEIATLDQISGGRVVLGIGAGWNEEEMEAHGTDPSTRFRLMRERVEAIKTLWTQEVAEYHGRHVDIPPTWQWPKPVQDPHPPILVGGAGPNVLNRVVNYGDGWLPSVSTTFTENLRGRVTPIEEFPDDVAKLQRLAEERGKPRPQVQCGVEIASRIPLGQLEEMGVTRLVVNVAGPVSEEEVRPALESARERIDGLTG